MAHSVAMESRHLVVGKWLRFLEKTVPSRSSRSTFKLQRMPEDTDSDQELEAKGQIQFNDFGCDMKLHMVVTGILYNSTVGTETENLIVFKGLADPNKKIGGDELNIAIILTVNLEDGTEYIEIYVQDAEEPVVYENSGVLMNGKFKIEVK